MSRAVLVMALARTFHRQPTDAELADFLLALRDLAGDRVYVPQREPAPDKVAEITALHDAGLSIRKIAREVGVSKSQVHRALSQMSALPLDSVAA